MEQVRYFIPTRGRVGKQLTLKNLPAGLHPLVTIVCPAEEVDAHRADWPDVRVVAQPEDIRTIGAKREWIYKTLAQDVEFAWQFDDDLIFKQYFSLDQKFRKPHHPILFEDAFNYIQRIYYVEQGFDVIGLGTSYFAPKGGIKPNYHLGFAFGFSHDARECIEMNRLDVFEDIDFTLQVLRKGIKNGVCYDIVVDQKQPDAPGGVTGERTSETIRRDLEKLISFHPGIVSEKPLRPGAHPAAITKVLWAKAAKEGGLK
jgi:hypothetical protein